MLAPITLVLAEGHDIFRSGFTILVKSEEDIQLLATATDCTTLLQQVHHCRPHIVLVALQLPGSIEACREIKRCYPQTIIVALGPASKEVTDRVLQHGACLVVNRHTGMSELLHCIKQLYYGVKNKSDAEDATELTEEMLPDLTQKERLVLEMICSGMESDEIGKKLFLSKPAVDHIRRNLLRKFSVSKTVKMAILAMRWKIVR